MGEGPSEQCPTPTNLSRARCTKKKVKGEIKRDEREGLRSAIRDTTDV